MATQSRIDTMLAHAGRVDQATGGVVPSLQLSTTFARDDDYQLLGDYSYRRYGSPTLAEAEAVLRDLDGGADALLFGTGLGASAALLETLRAGDRLVAPRIMYHGTQDWMRHLEERRGVVLTFFDAGDPDGLDQALATGRATMVWTESPVNPTWDVVDLTHAAEAAHRAGAVLVVDSTAAPPITTRPLALGADFVVHSATKYLNGHSDVLGGVVITQTLGTRWEEVMQIRKLTGGIMAPFEAWLLMRGLKTLAVRFDRCSASALQIAQHFHNHPSLEAVLYPGLESHPRHELAARQMTRGFGGMMSLMIRGDGVQTQAVARRLHTFVRATSLGGVESLAEHRATVEGPHSVVPHNLLRLSIGLEDPRDLIADLEAALAPAGAQV